jgi:hypothetical protein
MRKRSSVVFLAILYALAANATAGGVVGVNQAGYPRLARKIAILSQYADSVIVRSADAKVILHVVLQCGGSQRPRYQR